MSGIIDFRARIAQAAAFLAANYEANVHPVTNEFREIVLASYNWLSRSLREEEINPLSQQYTEQELANALNLALTGDYYYPSSAGMAMGGYKDLGTEFMMSTTNAGNSMTLTVQATDDTTNPPAAGSWVDVTLAGYNLLTGSASAASYVAAGAAGSVPATIVDWDNLNCRRFRVKVAVVYAANNALLTLWTRHKAL